MKKLICIICMLAMIVGSSSAVFANTNATPEIGLREMGVDIGVSGSSSMQKFIWEGYAIAELSTTEIKITMELQEQMPTGFWVAIEKSLPRVGKGYVQYRQENAFMDSGVYRVKATFETSQGIRVKYSEVLNYAAPN